MGKWSKIITDRKLTEVPEESAYQDKVNEAKKTVTARLIGDGERIETTMRRVNLETLLESAKEDEAEAHAKPLDVIDVKDLRAADFARQFKIARETKDHYKALADQAEVTVEAIRQLMLTAYEAEKVQKVTLSNGFNFAQEIEPYSSLASEELICPYCRHTEGEEAGTHKEISEAGVPKYCGYCDNTGKQTGKELFRRYCFNNPDLSQSMSLPWQTQNALVKSFLENGDEPPPGVKLYCKSKIVMRKPRGGGSSDGE